MEGWGRVEAQSDGVNLGIKLTLEGGRAGWLKWLPLINEGKPWSSTPLFPLLILENVHPGVDIRILEELDIVLMSTPGSGH